MNFKFILILLLILSSPLYATDICKEAAEQFLRSRSSTESGPSSLVPSYASRKGKFKSASDADNMKIKNAYDSKKGNFDKKMDSSKVRRLLDEDAGVNLGTLSKSALKRIRLEGIESIKKLVLITSGAGLASRMGGLVKAVEMVNFKQVKGLNAKLIEEAGDIFGAKTNIDTIKLAMKNKELFATFNSSLTSRLKSLKNIEKLSITDELQKQIDEVAVLVKDHAKRTNKRLLKNIAHNSRVKNPLDVKLTDAALLSIAGDTYVPLKIWTSSETHSTISNYISWLKNNYTIKQFSEDFETDQEIKRALKLYFEKADQLGDTFLFGYQEGVKAIDTATGEFLASSPEIGIGAGAIIEYGHKSGLFAELKAMGKVDAVFENIEVTSDMALLYGSHLRGGKKVSVVLVPEGPNYSGGTPFMIQQPDGSWQMQLVEGSVLAEEFKKGNPFFNSNTIFFSLNSDPIKSIGFELKEQGTIARVKLNMGDITFHYDAFSIIGRIGREYENNKDFREVGVNWQQTLVWKEKLWREIISYY